MARITIGLGVVLIALGVGGYLGTDRESITAMIPAFFGLPMAGLGVLAMKDDMRKIAIHIAVVLGVLGFGGTVSGLLKLPALLGGEELERPAAVGVQSAMAILCFIYVVLCVQSFLKARRSGVVEAASAE